jgi:TadE-like protein
MPTQPLIQRLARDARGTAVTEFVIVAPLFFALLLGIMEITLQFYYIAAAEKAAYAGARLAIVLNPMVAAVPATNARVSDSVAFGTPCRDASNPCVNFGTRTCTGNACVGGFSEMFTRMQGIFPPLAQANVRVEYRYIRLGFAGGKAYPSVTLVLTGIPMPAGPFAAVSMLLGGQAGGAVLPDIRVTLTGEDLSS